MFLGQLRWGEAVRTHLCTHAHAHTFTRGKGEACAHKRAVAEPSQWRLCHGSQTTPSTKPMTSLVPPDTFLEILWTNRSRDAI